MAIGSKTHINSLLKEYWLDVAGSTTAKSLNDAMRAGLIALGYSGGLTTMLKSWANDLAGTSNASISVALKNAALNMSGETVSDVTEGIKKIMKDINYESILVKWEEEKRQWNYID